MFYCISCIAQILFNDWFCQLVRHLVPPIGTTDRCHAKIASGTIFLFTRPCLGQNFVRQAVSGTKFCSPGRVWNKILFARPCLEQNFVRQAVSGTKFVRQGRIWNKILFARPYLEQNFVRQTVSGTKFCSPGCFWNKILLATPGLG